MDFNIRSNSFVLLSNNHNPGIISDSYLVMSGICSDINDLIKDNFVFTPSFSQFSLKSGVTAQLEIQRLAISSNSDASSDEPFRIGQIYLELNKFINAAAMGLNFEVELKDKSDWFEKYTLGSAQCSEIKFRDGICNITVKKDHNLYVNFNFHYEFNPICTLSEITTNLEKEAISHRLFIDKFIKSNF